MLPESLFEFHPKEPEERQAALWQETLCDRFLANLHRHWQLGLLDQDGRYIDEYADPDYPKGPVIEGSCPYSGSRYGQVYNIGALQQTQESLDWMCALIADWCGPQASAEKAWQASCAAYCLPLWSVVSRGPLPRRLASLYKACFGMSLFLSNLTLHHGLSSETLSQIMSPEDFYQELDRSGWLLGEGQVCAGSAGQIKRLFRAFCGDCSTEKAPQEGPVDSQNWDRNWPLLASQLAALQIILSSCSYRDLRRGSITPEERRNDLGCQILDGLQAPWLRTVRLRPPDNPQVVEALFASPPRPVSFLLSVCDQPAPQRTKTYIRVCRDLMRTTISSLSWT